MEKDTNEFNIGEIDKNQKDNEYLITSINDLGKALINYRQKTKNFKNIMTNHINSFQKEINTFEHIPLNAGKKIINFIHMLKEYLIDNESNNFLFFEEAKESYKKMKGNEKDINKPHQKNLYLEKHKNLIDSSKEIDELKSKNEELMKKISRKELLINELKKEYLFLNNIENTNFISDINIDEKKQNLLLIKKCSEQKKEIECLNKKLKKIMNEDELKNNILKANGITVIDGIELKNTSKDEIKEDWKDTIDKYQKENNNLKDFIDIEKQRNDLLMQSLLKENKELESKIKLLEEQNNELKKKYEELNKEYIINNSNRESINNISINTTFNINKGFNKNK